MELWLWLTCPEEGVDQTWSSEVEKWRIKVPVPQPQSQESYRANMGSIANPLRGKAFVIPERASGQLLESLSSGLGSGETRCLCFFCSQNRYGKNGERWPG